MVADLPAARAVPAPSATDPYPAGAYPRDGLSETIRHVLALIRRNALTIGAIVAGCIVLAVVLTMLETPRYTATTSIQINDQSEQVLGDDMENKQAVNNTWDVDRFLNTELQILQSRELAVRVANRLKLEDDPAFWTAMEAQPPDDTVPKGLRKDAVISMLRGSLQVELPFDTRIAMASYTSADPEMSAKIANAFAQEFIQSNLQRRYDSSSYAREFISGQLEEARARLEASERELNAYARSAGLIRSRSASAQDGGVTGGGSVTSDSLAQLNQAANEAQAARVAAESRWRAEAAQPLLSSREVLSNQTVQTLMTRRAELETRIDKLSARYLDDYPVLRDARSELAAVNRELQSVAKSVRSAVRTDYETAAAAERRLKSQVGGLQNATLAEQDRLVRYNTLAREADTNRTIYDGLLQRYRELNAAAGISTSNLSIIDQAQVPVSPSSPSLPRNLAIALLFGFAIAGAYVFIRDQMDDAIRIPEDVEGKVGISLLGVIPGAGDSTPEEELADPKSPMSEAYNALRGSLLYSTVHGLPKVILITSAQPGEGKSTTSQAIAHGLARMGRRAVLVDADLRRPSVQKRLGLKNKVGLSTLLTSDDKPDTVLVASDVPNLSYVTSGPLPPSPTELLSSPRFAAVLEDLLKDHDNVILDGPPVLGLADAPVLAALVDGVVLVIEAERMRRGVLKTAVRRLRAVSPVLLGGLLTKFDPSKAGNSNSDYYGYEYYRYSNSSGHEAAD